MAKLNRKRLPVTPDEPGGNVAVAESPLYVAESPQTLESAVVLDTKPVAQFEGALKGRSRTGMPIPPATKLQPEALFQFLKRLNDADWAHCDIYVNDKWPVCTRTPAYIAKLDRAIEMDYFERVLGSGDYIVRVNDTAIPGDRRTICECRVSFRDSAFPTKRNIEEVALNDPKNKEYVDYLKREGLVNGRNEIMTTAAAGNDSAVSIKLADALIASKTPPAMDPLVGILAAQLEATRKEAAETRKLLLDMALKPPPAAGDNGTTAMLQILQTQLVAANAQVMALQQQQHEINLATINRKPEVATGRGMTVEDYLELEERIEQRAAKRNPSAEKEDSWMGVVERLAPAAINLAQAYSSRIAAVGPQPVAPALRPQLMPMPMSMNTKPAVDPAQQAEFEACIETMRSHGSHLIAALDAHVAGDVFAEGLETQLGPDAYDAVAKYGRDMLYQAIVAVPELAARVQGREQNLSDFVEAFCAFGEAPPAPDGEPGTAAATEPA